MADKPACVKHGAIQEIGSNCNVWREIAHSGLEGM